MALLPVDEALRRLLEGAGPVGQEVVPIEEAAGRVLAGPLRALRTQPPFDASAMDGYAVRAADVVEAPARLTVIGSAPAGRPFKGAVGPRQAIRIFTGAPVPAGADTIVIQENTRDAGNGIVEVAEPAAVGRHIRRAGLDFSEGDLLLEDGRLLDPAALSLAAAANHPRVTVVRQPLVALIATGDELLPPGSDVGPGQIIASNAYGIAASLRAVGARVLDLGIASDRRDALAGFVRRALEAGADVIVTLGGASVGDHDLVHEVLTAEGMSLDFWKIAMRPGKPLMFGRLPHRTRRWEPVSGKSDAKTESLSGSNDSIGASAAQGNTRCVGLPGNPVASLICTELFLKPLVARLGGRQHTPDIRGAVLAAPMNANDQRQDYVRAIATPSAEGLHVTPLPVQDSSMLRMLASANALIIREPFAAPADVGAPCRVMMLR